jgi:hypothetical protein
VKAQRDVSPDPSTTTNFFGVLEVSMKLTVRYDFNNQKEINPEAKKRKNLKIVLMLSLVPHPQDYSRAARPMLQRQTEI